MGTARWGGLCAWGGFQALPAAFALANEAAAACRVRAEAVREGGAPVKEAGRVLQLPALNPETCPDCSD